MFKSTSTGGTNCYVVHKAVFCLKGGRGGEEGVSVCASVCKVGRR